MTAIAQATTRQVLAPYALFGAAVAFAGPPIYIHTPSLYASQHGLSLATVGVVLLAVRMLDFVQDPLLGWWIGRNTAHRRRIATGFGLLLGVGALALFAPAPLPMPAVWLVASLACVFTAFSGLQILYYSSGVVLGRELPGGHNLVAGWREAGILAGVCAACVAPTLAEMLVGKALAFPVFAAVFCVLLAAAVVQMRPWWPSAGATTLMPSGFREVLADSRVQRLLAIGLVNSLPTGLTATLFVFFVEDRLQAPAHAGPALLLFFAAAAAAAPLWARLANRIGAKRALLLGMGGAIAAFLGALTLGAGDWPAFYLICIASGFAVGGDMTLLPAMLSARLSERESGGEMAFGLWGFVNKASLALAAGLALPALGAAGFAPNQENSPAALEALSIAYAAVPCALKAAAAIALSLTRIPEGDRS